MKPTTIEIENGLKPKWVNTKEALGIFSKYNEYAKTFEVKRGLYLRELKALKELIIQKWIFRKIYFTKINLR